MIIVLAIISVVALTATFIWYRNSRRARGAIPHLREISLGLTNRQAKVIRDFQLCVDTDKFERRLVTIQLGDKRYLLSVDQKKRPRYWLRVWSGEDDHIFECGRRHLMASLIDNIIHNLAKNLLPLEDRVSGEELERFNKECDELIEEGAAVLAECEEVLSASDSDDRMDCAPNETETAVDVPPDAPEDSPDAIKEDAQ